MDPVEDENVDGRSVRQAKGHPAGGPLTTLSSFEKSKLAKVETPGTTYVHEWVGAHGIAVKVAVQGNPLSRVGSHLYAVRAHVLFNGLPQIKIIFAIEGGTIRICRVIKRYL